MVNTKKKLLLPAAMARAGWDVIKNRKDVEAVGFDYNIPTASFHALLGDAHGVALSLTPFSEAEVQAAPQLRVVARHGVGYDSVDVAALTRRKIPLMITGTANSSAVAEQAVHFMMALAKRGARMHAMVQQGHWRDRLSELPVDFFGKTILLIGFGRVGSRVARVCLALDMNVLVYDPYVSPEVIRGRGCSPVSELDAALPRADFVSIHSPKTSETSGMFDAARLSRMKTTAYLVNTSRGGIVDEIALHAALTGGVIQGAGLDVFDREPPLPDNPLLGLPNVITAPHMAGVTKESLDRMAVTTARNLLDVLDGKPNVDYIVNKEVLAGEALANQ